MSKATSDKDFESLLDNYDYKFKKGDLVKGVVFGYESDNALVDIGAKSVAIVPRKEASVDYDAKIQDVLEKNTAKKFKGSELKLLQKKQKHLEKIERAIAELEQKKQILEAELSQNYTLETYKQFEACCQQLQVLENEWLESADVV